MNQPKLTNKEDNDENQSLISHIEALRKMLLNSLIAVFALCPAGFFLAPKVINFLVKNSLPSQISKLHFFSPIEVFIIQLKTGLIIALILAFPFIANEIKKFILPALYEHEKKFLSWLFFSSTILFAVGSLVCIFLILPLIMNFSAGFATENIQATIGIGNFINISGGLIIAFGLMFQFPLLIILAVKLNFIEPESLKNKRPYVLVSILILSAILTPPNIISQLLLGVPTYILFETGLFIAEKIR